MVMKFYCSVEINSNIDDVVAKFENKTTLKEWQEGFVSYNLVSGIQGQKGAKSKLVYINGKNTIELIETILNNNLPEEFFALYEHKHMVNTMKSLFSKISENSTRYQAEIEYTQFIGFLPKIMALLMPGIFKKQTQKMIDNFKLFVEKSI